MAVALLPAASNARALFIGFGTSHTQLYGTAVSVHCNDPLTKNSTRATPTLSFAVAVIVTFDFRATTPPFAGFVIDTVVDCDLPRGTGIDVPKDHGE